MNRVIFVGIVLLGLAAAGQTPEKGPDGKLDTPLQKKLDALLKQLEAKEPEARVAAIAEIAKLDAVAAVPALAGVLAMPDEELRLHAALALGGLGKGAVPALEKALTHPHETVRFYAVWALGLAGSAAKSATPAVIKALGDEDGEVRYKAAFALARVGADSDEALAALIAALGDADPDVCEEASASLARVGPRAVAPLRKALGNAKVSIRAADALSKMARGEDSDAVKAAGAALPEVLQALDGGRPTDVNALQMILPAYGVKALPAFRIALKDNNSQNRIRIANGLGVIAQEAEGQGDAGGVHGVLELLIQLLSDSDPQVRLASCRSFGMFNSLADQSQPALEKAFADDVHGVALMAFQTLTNRGLPPAEFQDKLAQRIAIAKGDEKLRLVSLVPDAHHKLLMANLQHKDAAVRLRCVCGLATVVSSTGAADVRKQIEPMLVEMLSNAPVVSRRDAAQALARMAGQCGKTVIEPLFSAFKDTDPEVRAAAMIALAQVPGRDGKHLAAALVPLLHDANWTVQQTAINTLMQCGDDANVHWLALLKDKEMPLRAIACNILKQKKQELRALTPALVAMAREPDSRWLAAGTLHEIAAPTSFGLLFEMLQADKTLGPALRRVDKSGKDPAKVVAALLREVKDADAGVCRGAAAALEQIVLILPPGDTLVLKKQDVVPAMKALVPPLAKKLTTGDAAARRASVDMLGQLRSLTTTIEQRVSTSPSEEVIKLYGEIEPLRQEIETALQKARNDSDNQVRRAARQALRAPSFGDSVVFPVGIGPLFPRLGGPVP